eukprot:GILJ01002898.1.p1 GENE.GILJ01002898.1~~GILJ01002898.1.p1  ORF type:complete len:151 (-),score=28.94 GILJ01002898.1:365-817(-)
MQTILSQDDIDRCRVAFTHFDRDGSGTIDRFEIRMVLEAMGQRPSEEEIFHMISEVDIDGSGQIEFGEFLRVMEQQKGKIIELGDESDLVDAFAAMGGKTDKTGSVRKDRLIQVIKHDFGLTIDIEAMIASIDRSGTGQLSYEDFKQLLS